MADHGSARLRELLFSRCDVDAIVGFDNRDGVFAVHRSIRFLLLTATGGTADARRSPAALASGIRPRSSPAGPENDDVVVSGPGHSRILERLTGPDLALPEFISRLDVTIAERAAALFRPLGDAAGWAARFGRELNATDDRESLVARRAAACRSSRENRSSRSASTSAGARWSIAPAPPTGCSAAGIAGWRLAYRDVASATNRTTLIAAMLPPAPQRHTRCSACARPLPRRAQHFLCGLFNSFVVNYLVRLARDHARHDGDRRATADPDARRGSGCVREIVQHRGRLSAVRLKADPRP